MLVEICEQGSEEWYKLKLGVPSASNASKILTNDGKISKQREGYLYELCAERISGQREEGYKNANMLMGQEREDESRMMYELINSVEVSKVGVIYKDERKEFLCSPDGVIKNEYGLELKNVLGKTQIKYLLDGGIPSEYFSQIQFSLYITGFNRWDFMSYAPGIRPLLIRIERDVKFIKALEIELEIFVKELAELVEKIR